MNSKIVLALLACLWAVPLQAATVYVRAGAVGAGTGANWTDALTALPATVRGNTYYIAAGSYSGFILTTAVSGTTTIVLKGATVADHGTDTGWIASYGASNPVFATIQYTTKYVDSYRLTSADYISLNASLNPTSVTFLNLYDMTALYVFIVAQDVLVQRGSFGGYDPCSTGGEDIFAIWDNGVDTASRRITVDGATIHDNTDHGNVCAGFPNAGIHVDCMQILGGHDITIKNNLFYNCATSGILGSSFRDTLDGLLVENNMFQAVQSPGATLNFGATCSGTNTFRYNTINGFSSFAQTGCTTSVYGNILSVSACGAGTYDYNLFVGGTTCGTNTRTGSPAFVSTPSPSYNNGLVPDYHLTAGDTAARDLGNPASYPATDYDGVARYLGSAPDLGADEAAAGSGSSRVPIIGGGYY